jgi:nicotinamidase-related amidase
VSEQPPWAGVVTEEDERRYEAAGFGRPGGAGSSPALLVIDVQYRTTGTEPRPFFDAVNEYTTSCGDAAWDALPNIGRLVRAFREEGLPILYPHVAPKRAYDKGQLGAKVPAIMNIPEAGYRFVEEIAPEADDVLVPKQHPSAFFGTALASYLIARHCDWVVVTGCTTSGCVRSSVVDAFAYNFHVTVPHDAVYDRSPTVHAVNLFDMAQKYADVVSTDQALELVSSREKEAVA